MSSTRPKRTAKTPNRFHEEGTASLQEEKVEKKKKVPVKKTKKTIKKKGKKEKDPNAPKRPMTGYIIFTTEERPKAKADNPELGFGPLTKFVSNKWKAMSDDEKAPYLEKAAKDKERYEAECEKYKASKSDDSSKSEEGSASDEGDDDGDE